MDLNLPIYDALDGCKNVLIAGMGGGFDLFCGLPIYFSLKERGINVHLANYSFTEFSQKRIASKNWLSPTLLGTDSNIKGVFVYFPELYLSQWFKQVYDEDVIVWTFYKTGVIPLLENYQSLVEHLSIDAIVLLDGGVDSLMRGDEAAMGTYVHDTVSLIAVNEVEGVRVKLIGCLGFGAEPDIAYGHVLENIADLNRRGAFLGSCSLAPQMNAYQQYQHAVQFVHDRPHQPPSSINSAVIAAVEGHAGNQNLTGFTQWVSPLMAIYWFFELRQVAQLTQIYTELRYTETARDMLRAAIMATRHVLKRRGDGTIPL